MWPFSNKTDSLQDSGLFKGYVDWHSHVLPGVDDGIKTNDDAIRVLEAYDNLGYKKLWLTPHIMEDYPNTTTDLKARFDDLKKAWNGNMELALASENMLDNLFEARLENNDFLPIGEDGRHLLIETSYYTPPFGMDDMINRIFELGYFPVLAHPERYRYMETKDYERLKDKGIFFQLNFLSLVGAYGESARKKAEWLLDHDMIDVMGSDIHRLDAVMQSFALSPSKKKYIDKILRVANEKNSLN